MSNAHAFYLLLAFWLGVGLGKTVSKDCAPVWTPFVVVTLGVVVSIFLRGLYGG